MFQSSKVVDLSRSSRVKSKMAPHLKINFMVYRLIVETHVFITICTILQFYRALTCDVVGPLEKRYNLIFTLMLFLHVIVRLCFLCTYG